MLRSMELIKRLAKPVSNIPKKKRKQHHAMTYFLLSFFALIALLPLYYLVITSMKDLNEASTMATMWPQSFALFDNIRFVLNYPDYNVVRMFINTMIVFVLKAVGTGLTCSLAAYGFAMYKFPFKNTIFFILLSAMMIPGELLGIPIFEFMVNTGLKEIAYIPLWIGAWFATDIFMIFLFRQFFQTIPKSLIEAARMDGYSELQIFFKIAIPLNKPVFVTVIILYFIGTYNDLYGPALYITQKSDWLMANSISIFENMYRSGSSSYLVPWNYVSVASLIALMPEVLLFSFMQKQFMETAAGVGIKG
ncbi:MAG: carbohydrate ABC transporter permease [Candidatus Izemoplasmatales bacterium]|jgi:multiple sugar transport system permease protein|nr:carbohydrate ABC transporter permease [bacterium]MDZ4196810.1 carbohydrate ABC transporter permease [Candidatus Izemoplasmatales bacterium]